MCLLNYYAQVLVLLFSETNPWLFSSGLVLLPWKFTLSLCRFGRYLGLEKISYNANEWILTQKSLSDIVESALIMLWREKEQQITNEPRHDKTDKMSVRPPSEDTDQPGHPPSLIRVFAVRMKNAWSLATHWLHCEDSGQTGWMPRLIWVFAGWAYTHFVGFVMSRLKLNFILSRCARDKSFIARKPEVHSILLVLKKLLKKCNPSDFKFYLSKLTYKKSPYGVMLNFLRCLYNCLMQ